MEKKTVNLVRVAMFSAISFVIMTIKIPVWFAPMFYKLDLSEVFVLIGAFSLGPFYGMLIELLKNLLSLVIRGTNTACIGEFSNFLIGCSLVLPSSIVYKRYHTKKGAIKALFIGMICLLIVSSFINALFLIPMYSCFFNIRIENILIFILEVIIPFNLIKGFLSCFLCFVLYKKTKEIIIKE